MNSFTHNIWYVRNPSNFKLLTLELYNGRIDLTPHPMRYIRHMDVLGASEEVMRRFSLYSIELVAVVPTLRERVYKHEVRLIDRFLRQFTVHIS